MVNADLLWYDRSANLDLFWPGGPRLHGLSAEVHLQGRVVSLPGDEPHCQIGTDRATWYVAAHGLQVAWRWQSAARPSAAPTADSGDRSTRPPKYPGLPIADGWDVWLEVTNTSRRTIRLEAVEPLRVLVCDLRTPIAPVFYQHGWSSGTPTFSRHPSGNHYVHPGTSEYGTFHQPHVGFGDANEFISESVTVIKSPAASMLVGFVTGADQLTSIRMDEPQLVTRCWLDGADLKPGRTIWSERLWLKAGNNPLALLEAWAKRVGKEMNARLERRPPTGWCARYQFFGNDTAADTEANLALIDEKDLPLDVILVDDGYQSAIGDWLAVNSRFPEGMKKLADRIRATGRSAGIWTAPFGAAAESRLFSQHPDWFIQDRQGLPVIAWQHQSRTNCYALDPTHPGAAAWLADTFQTLRRKWGYTFFKLDYLFAASIHGRRHDATATRASSLRRGLEIIREAVGDDAFLLGCGAPQLACAGLVDGMRTGPDVAPYWTPKEVDLSKPAQLNALRNSIARAPFHNRLWLNDPDCLMIRRRGNDSNLFLSEVRSQVALTALLGGLTLDSDDLTRVRSGRLKYLRQALPPTGVSARPLDLFDNELPRTLLLPVERDWGRWWVTALINWQDLTVETTVRLDELGLPFDSYHVYDYWRRRYLSIARDEVILPLHRPHETRVLLFKPVAEQPDLLTSTFHVCQGTVEVKNVERERAENGLRLHVVLEKAGRQFGELLFTAPEPWQATAARVDGSGRQLTTVAPGVVSLGFTLSGTATIQVDYCQSA